MSSIEIQAGIPTGYEQTIDWDLLHETARLKSQDVINEAAALAIIGTANDPGVAIANASVDSMGQE